MIGPKLITAPPTGGHVFHRTGTTFELNQHIIKTDIKTKLHEDWALNVTSTVFELDRDIIGTNLLTKFHEDRTMSVASRVFTNKCGWTDGRWTDKELSRMKTGTIFKLNSLFPCFHYIHIEKNAPPTGGHIFSLIWTIFELVLKKSIKPMKNAPPTGGHVFQWTGTTFKLNQHIIKTNILTKDLLLTKFYEDRTINVASRDGQRPVKIAHLSNQAKNVTSRETNVLTKFHKDLNKNLTSRETAPPPGGHVFSQIWTIFELFYDDWAKIVNSRVNTALPPGGHLHEDWASNVTSTHDPVSNLVDIIKTNVLTKFNEDRTINGASRVFTR
ncbi:hypothetical protein DPMN_132952 [Dreissena polymorpha]|uniref:Uncharacterized protein n=1 Tax=Dreissena polymorpha TaxID=45954 RepID=A0A9D4JCI1_DREPO|nr:hypothetical protein DPMN_132952 [Dreissena polymorpha]